MFGDSEFVAVRLQKFLLEQTSDVNWRASSTAPSAWPRGTWIGPPTKRPGVAPTRALVVTLRSVLSTAWLVYVRGDMGGPATRSFGAPPLSAGASVFGLQETEHKAVPVDAVGIGAFPDDWKTLKPTTPFLELPILETPAGTIGHELAILNYIGQQSQRMAGHDLTEFAISQQLLSQAEDMYQKMIKLSLQLKTEQITGEEAAAFWTDEDEQTHNRRRPRGDPQKGAFYKSSGGTGGKFTSSGITVGECKLFSTLHAMKLAKDDILADYAELSGFYDRFAAEAATQAILKGEGSLAERCCHHSHIACEHEPGKPHLGHLVAHPAPPLFNCRAGLWNFRKAWFRLQPASGRRAMCFRLFTCTHSTASLDWCCDREHLGCESEPDVVILPATNKPVAKCQGFETQKESCHSTPCEETCEPVHCEFSDWSSWENLGGCFGLCQRERRIVQANNICGRPCSGPKVTTKAGGHLCVPDDRCSMLGNVDCQWTEWSTWSHTCFNIEVDQSRAELLSQAGAAYPSGLPELLNSSICNLQESFAIYRNLNRSIS
eukprot:s453_g8.t1